jgi:hypothetical protein
MHQGNYTIDEPAATAAWNARGGGEGPKDGGTSILNEELDSRAHGDQINCISAADYGGCSNAHHFSISGSNSSRSLSSAGAASEAAAAPSPLPPYLQPPHRMPPKTII